MLAAIASLLLGGGLINLLVDGAKQLSAVYDRSRDLYKHLLVWGCAVLFILLLRGFDLPSSLFGWLYFFVTIGVVGLVAYGFFRLRQATVGVSLGDSELDDEEILVAPVSPTGAVRPPHGGLT